MKKINLFVIILICLVPKISLAQKNVIDEVIWIVGDDAILKSEVEEQRLRSIYENNPIEGDPYCVIPEQLAIQKLFLHQAAIDSITVSEAMVNSQVDARINYYIAQIGSKEKMEEYFKKNSTVLREELREMVRNQQIIQEMQKKLVANIKSTPADIRRYYNQMSKDSLPLVPAQVELQIISFEPEIPNEEIVRIKEKLREFTERANKKEGDFALLARFYSEDIESAKKGGELGFMGRGQLVPEFAAVAFNLVDPKKVSRIVQTEFGYHIIQLIEKKGDRVNCRHILLKPRISIVEKEKAIKDLDSISNLIRTGKYNFEQAVIRFSEDKNSYMNAGLMLNEKTGNSKFEFQELPSEIGKVVYNMNVGEISKPFSMINPATNKEVVAIVKLKTKTDIHKANLTDDYQMVKAMYENTMQQEFIHNWIIKKQKETYINIDPKWANCKFEYPGWIK